MNKKIENTEQTVLENPVGFLNSSLGLGTSLTITAMEKAGQLQLAQSSQLPMHINLHVFDDTERYGVKYEFSPTDFNRLFPLAKPFYEKLGIKVLGESPGDPKFVDCELPAGWKIKPTDHSMWSQLLDEQNHERGAIFYKAAFYDRKAHFNLSKRYSYTCFRSVDVDGNAVDNNVESSHFATIVTDCGVEIYRIGIREAKTYRGEDDKLAELWLNENFPDWLNPYAYWSEKK